MTVSKDPLLSSPTGLPHRPSRCYSDDLRDYKPPETPNSPTAAHVGSATLKQARNNLVLAVLGAGQLTLPYAMSQLGLPLGVGALVVFTWLSMHSLYVLSIYELHHRPCATDCLESYSELVTRVLGTFGSHVCSVLLALYAWGGAVSFMVILKGEFGWAGSIIAARAYGQEVSVPEEFIGKCVLLLLATLFLWPLSSLEDLSPLKKFSFLGCCSAIFITIVALLNWIPFANWHDWLLRPNTVEFRLPSFDCAGPVGSGEGHGVRQWWPSSLQSVAATLPLFAFALNSSWAYIPILCTLSEKRRVRSFILTSNAIIFVNYSLLSLAGSGMYCGEVRPNILDSLGRSMPHLGYVQFGAIGFARCALMLQLSLALPLRFFVARRAIGPNVESVAGRIGLAGALVASAWLLTVPPLSLALALGVTSSVCASMIIYILPAVVDLRLRLRVKGTATNFPRLCASALSLAVGGFILVGGLWGNLSGTGPAVA